LTYFGVGASAAVALLAIACSSIARRAALAFRVTDDM